MTLGKLLETFLGRLNKKLAVKKIRNQYNFFIKFENRNIWEKQNDIDQTFQCYLYRNPDQRVDCIKAKQKKTSIRLFKLLDLSSKFTSWQTNKFLNSGIRRIDLMS